jgi:serine/threonine protein kinase/Tol biopolymer transport system component
MAKNLSPKDSHLTAGSKLGRYEIRSQIGSGGMGEVYLALDSKLERSVALKILPEQVSADHGRMVRFTQEAKSASALNHPNIITIHEVEHADGVNFIVMEFVDGETLRQHVARTRMSVPEVLDVVIQLASALAAAHEAGIVHRDIKPDNIMLRRDGIVKVLDFGLAKLTEKAFSIDPEAPTRALVNTAPGMVMGTASYMSPEQARGIEVDARTDIWSAGILLYEMLTGRVPFTGNTTSDVIASILKTTPVALSRVDGDIPQRLDEVVTKALEKDREERYQGIRDLLVDLRKLKKRIEFQAELERSETPSLPKTPDRQTKQTATESASPGPSTNTITAQPASGAEYIVDNLKQHKRALFAGLLVLVTAAVGIFFWFKNARRSDPGAAEPSFASFKLTRLTGTGKARHAAISPDGNYVVHVVDDSGKQSLWVRQVATSSNVQIVPPAEVNYWGITFSRDGNYIYYVFRQSGAGVGFLFRVPTLGGPPVKLVEDVDSPVTLSPDGKQIAFVRWNPRQGDNAVWIANVDGSAQRRIAIRKFQEQFGAPADSFNEGSGPSWSPDGKTIACSLTTTENGITSRNVVAINATDGSQKLVSSQKWASIGRMTWLTSGVGLLLTARNQPSSPSNQIWYVSYATGQARQVTNDLSNYTDVTLTSQSSTIAVIQSDIESHVWVAPEGDAGRARQVGSSQNERVGGVAIGPGGRVVYVSALGGNNLDIWIADADGSNARQLTTDGYAEINPAVSPDGRYIVFASNRTGDYHLWRINIDGNDARQLTNGDGEHSAGFSPDGQWIVYYWETGLDLLWKMPVEGGNALKLGAFDSNWPTVSPDGKHIAAWTYSDYIREGVTASRNQLLILSFETGQVVKVLEVPQSSQVSSNLQWSGDGRAVMFVDVKSGVANIWSQPIDGGAAKQLTSFKSDLIISFAWSRDGKELVCSRGSVTSDVVLMTDIK